MNDEVADILSVVKARLLILYVWPVGILIPNEALKVPVIPVFFSNDIDVIFPWTPKILDLQYKWTYWLLLVPSIIAIWLDCVELAFPNIAEYGAP